MIYITGDTHGSFRDFSERIHSKNVKKGDIVIVCGDFGFLWGDQMHNYYLQMLRFEPYTILFVDGNHENFDMLNEYPVTEWNGGKVHKIHENIYHLMRGQVFDIENKKFFTFGGAYSIDKAMRRPNISWWKEELPTNEDYDTAKANLEKCGYKVDYVITHTIPQSAIHRLSKIPDPNDAELTGYFEWLYNNLEFTKWYAGHFHTNILINDNLQILYGLIQELQ